MKLSIAFFVLISTISYLGGQGIDTQKIADADNIDDHVLAAEYLIDYLSERDTTLDVTLIQIYLEIADRLAFTIHIDKAMLYLEKAHDTYNTLGLDRSTILCEIFYIRGMLYYLNSCPTTSIVWLIEAIDVYENNKEEFVLPKDLHIIYRLYSFATGCTRDLYDFELSEIYMSRVQAFVGTDKLRRFHTETQWISLHINKKEFFEASKRLEELLNSLPDANPSGFNYGVTLYKLGLCYYEMGEYNAALENFQRARPIISKFLWSGSIWSARFLVDLDAYLIRLATIEGSKAKIDLILKDALVYKAIFDGESNQSPLAEIYIATAEGYTLLGQIEKAKSYLDSAASFLVLEKEEFTDLGLPVVFGNTSFTNEYLLGLLEAYQLIFEKEYELGNPKGLDYALETYQSIDSFLRISRDNLSLTSSIGKSIQEGRKHHEHAASLALRLYRERKDKKYLDQAWQIITAQKSNLLHRYLQGPLLADAMGVPQSVVDDKTRLELKLLQFEKELNEASPQLEHTIEDSIIFYNQQLVRFNDQLVEDYPDFTNALRGRAPVDAKSLQQKLPKNQLLIEYFLGDDSLYVFTLAHSNGLGIEVLPIPHKIEQDDFNIVANAKMASQLYQEILAPVLSKASPHINRLMVIPDGKLWQIPFAALKKNDDFLIRSYAISYAYATSMVYDDKSAQSLHKAKENFAGFGLSYDNIMQEIQAGGVRSITDEDLLQLPSLPYAVAEVSTIGELLNGQYWLEEDATEYQFDLNAPNYQQIHLAMHGLKDPRNPLENALIFAGEEKVGRYSLLTTREILGMKIKADLVVLSACHTGAGPLEEGEGVQSMARAFAFAGASSTLASSWEASDEITHNMLIQFYEELENGAAKDVALQNAMITYLDGTSPAFQAPLFWANLTLTGDSSPVNRPRIRGWKWLVIVLGLAGPLTLAGWIRRKA